MSEDNKKGWLGQPHVMKSLSKKFRQLMEKIQTLKTAGTLGFITIKPEEEEKLDLEGQKTYQSGTRFKQCSM